MTVTDPGPATSALIDRAKNIILKPTEEWTKIEPEAATVQSLYTGYIMPLAAIPIIAGAIGTLIFGIGGMGFMIRMSPVAVIVGAVVQYAFALAGVYIMGLVINALADTFGAKKDEMQALKVAAYSGTAAWLAGVFGLFPPLALLAIVGLYSLFLLYRGLPILMKAPADKALGYTASVVVVLLVVGIVFAALSSCVVGIGRIGG